MEISDLEAQGNFTFWNELITERNIVILNERADIKERSLVIGLHHVGSEAGGRFKLLCTFVFSGRQISY